MKDLKPCPCCPVSALVQHIYPDRKVIVCTSCGASAELDAWNTRPIEDRLRAKIAGLKSAYDNLAQGHHHDHHVTIPALVGELRGTGKILERMDKAGSWGVMVDAAELQKLEAELIRWRSSHIYEMDAATGAVRILRCPNCAPATNATESAPC